MTGGGENSDGRIVRVAAAEKKPVYSAWIEHPAGTYTAVKSGSKIVLTKGEFLVRNFSPSATYETTVWGDAVAKPDSGTTAIAIGFVRHPITQQKAL